MSEGNLGSRNLISRAVTFRVSKWLRKHGPECVARGLLIGQVAEVVTKAMEMEPGSISAGNIKSICSDFEIDRCWVFKPRKMSGCKHRVTVALLADQIINLANEQRRLCDRLGEPFDPDGIIDLEQLRRVRGFSPPEPESQTHSEVKPLS